jgi:hypothetical protein
VTPAVLSGCTPTRSHGGAPSPPRSSKGCRADCGDRPAAGSRPPRGRRPTRGTCSGRRQRRIFVGSCDAGASSTTLGAPPRGRGVHSSTARDRRSRPPPSTPSRGCCPARSTGCTCRTI